MPEPSGWQLTITAEAEVVPGPALDPEPDPEPEPDDEQGDEQ